MFNVVSNNLPSLLDKYQSVLRFYLISNDFPITPKLRDINKSNIRNSNVTYKLP